jgi:hypothetical protein|tara:strand:+ start:5085 stop:5822 length:738 start_codon:yes stop_codon:yes gene_type:complete
MSIKSGLNQRFYVHGNDLSGDVASITTAEGMFDEYDITDITKVAHARILGQASGRMEWSSFFNDAAGQSHAVLSAMPLTDVVVTWLLGTALGDPTFSLVSKLASAYAPTRARDGSMDISARAEGSAGAPLEEGVALTAADDTFSSASSATSIDQTAQTTLGATAVCHVLSIGSGTPTILIEDSANNSSWATLLTFGAQAVNTGKRVTSTATVDRYVRITTTGTFTDCVVVVTLRRGLTGDVVDLS